MNRSFILSTGLFLAACKKELPVAELPLSPRQSKIAGVQFELQLPESATPSSRSAADALEWNRVSASEVVRVSVQVGSPVKLESALRFESQKGGAVLRSTELSDGYAMTTPNASQRAIALGDRGVYCRASLDVPKGEPSPEQLAYLDTICASLKVQAN